MIGGQRVGFRRGRRDAKLLGQIPALLPNRAVVLAELLGGVAHGLGV
jgi:hypothetical protein